MKKSTKVILIILLAILLPGGLAIGGYFLYKKVKSDKEDSDESNEPIIAYKEEQNDAFPLKKNSHVKSDLVLQLQQKLNDRIKGLTMPNLPSYQGIAIHELKEDGYYGDKTAAVVAWVLKNDGNSVTKTEFNSL